MSLSRRDFVRNLFVASQVALASRFVPGQLHAEDASTGALNFAVIGDWGREGHEGQTEVAAQMAKACKDFSASFVVSLGDNFYENGVSSVDDPHWHKSFENVYSAESLQVPWYVILGNHDYRGSCEAQIEYGKLHPRWIMPARYYSKVHPVDASTQLEFFYIDTSPFIEEYFKEADMAAVLTQDTTAQLKWLDQALTSSKAQWKIVHGHHPIYSAGAGHGPQQELIARLLPLLQKHKVQAYFAGHDHDLQHLKTGGLNMLISGGGSRHRPVFPVIQSQFAQGCSGFTMVSLKANEMQVRFVDDTGTLLYTAVVPRSV